MNTIYLVRHSKATGQDSDAPLTDEGEREAELLATHLLDKGIERIISSPFYRAIQSIKPLARQAGIAIETDARLVERVLCSESQLDWMKMLAASFADPDLCYEGGESGCSAAQRIRQVFDEATQHSAKTTVLVSHGNLLALLIRQFDVTFGFDSWQAMTNPDVFRVTTAGESTLFEHFWDRK